MGVVDEDFFTGDMPGLEKESVGYRAEDGKIFLIGGFKETQGIKK